MSLASLIKSFKTPSVATLNSRLQSPRGASGPAALMTPSKNTINTGSQNTFNYFTWGGLGLWLGEYAQYNQPPYEIDIAGVSLWNVGQNYLPPSLADNNYIQGYNSNCSAVMVALNESGNDPIYLAPGMGFINLPFYRIFVFPILTGDTVSSPWDTSVTFAYTQTPHAQLIMRPYEPLASNGDVTGSVTVPVASNPAKVTVIDNMRPERRQITICNLGTPPLIIQPLKSLATNHVNGVYLAPNASIQFQSTCGWGAANTSTTETGIVAGVIEMY